MKAHEGMWSVVTTAPTKSEVEDNIDRALAENEASNNGAKATPPKARKRTSRKAAPKPPEDRPADEAPPVDPYKLKSFSTREVPWSRIGDIGEHALTSAEAAERGGLNFDVELVDAGFKSSAKQRNGESPWRTISHRRACIRSDTQQFFSFVSSTYTPVQYRDAFAFMDAIAPLYVAAGTLGGGRQGFMVVQLPKLKTVEVKVGKTIDRLNMYCILRTSHDLTRAIEVSAMMLRDKCMNALSLRSFTTEADQRWSVKHVGKDPMAKMAVATETLLRAQAYADAFRNTVKELAEIKLTMESAEETLRAVLLRRPKLDEQVNAILHAWRESPTNGFTDNGWGLVNAVSEYFEWGRNEGTRTDQSRFTGGLTGATQRFVNRTAQRLLQRRR